MLLDMTNFGRVFAVLVCCIAGMVACVATPSKKYPQNMTADRGLQKKLEQQLALIASDEAVRQHFNKVMRSRTHICQRCHGVDGHSRNKRCPNLAGQDPGYLAQQLQHFSHGRRQDFQMQSIAKGITDNDKVAVAIFFSRMTPRPATVQNNEQTIRGEAIFRISCAQCHGKQGQGQYTYPRLAGQLPGYISMSLYEFRKSNSRRQATIMRTIASLLSDEDIKALAAYISAME